MKKIKRLFTALLLLLLIGTAAVTVVLLNPGWLFKAGTGHAGGPGAGENFGRAGINIALLGFDRSAQRDQTFTIYRPDTILIASLDLDSGEVSLVNIPRDSYTAIAGTEIYDKINHAYMYGHNLAGAEDPHRSGIDTTLRTIEDFLGGVPVDYYVMLDMDGVVEIVDRLGGIEYEVEYPVRADFGRGELLLDRGLQRLDGRKFLTYVRDRSVDGDTGRSRRQQQILIAAFAQLKSGGNLSDIPALYRSLSRNLETDLSSAQIASLSVFGARVRPERIRTYVFPGSIQFAPLGELDISYIVIDEPSRVRLIWEIFGVSVEPRAQITLPGPRRPAAAVKMEPPGYRAPGAPVSPPAEPVPGNNPPPDLPGEDPAAGGGKEE